MVVRALATLGVALLFVAGCRDILGVKGYGVYADATEAGPKNACTRVADAGSTCATCVANHCCDEWDACMKEPACKAMNLCVTSCRDKDDHQCRGPCNQSIPHTQEWGDLVACEATQCPTCPGSRLIRGAAPCDDCLARECASDVDTLSRYPTALRLDDCRENCLAVPDADRAATGCTCAEYAQGARAVDAVDKCEESHCGGEICYPQVEWSCLGQVQLPGPESDPAGMVQPLDLHVGVVDARTFVSPVVQNLGVAACSPHDVSCGMPIVMTTTSTDGWLDLMPILETQSQQPWFFEYLLVTNPGDVDALFYFFPPVRRSPSWRTRRLVTQDYAQQEVNLLAMTINWHDKGGIVWSVTSCGVQPPLHFASGVSVSATPDAATPDAGMWMAPTYYIDGDVLRPETQLSATTLSGVGAMINVHPGHWTLTASTKDSNAGGGILGTYHIQVSAGKLTHVTMAPMPRPTGD